MTGALALVAALVTSQIQTHPTGLKTVGLSHRRGSVRTVQILDKLREQAGMPSLDLDFARYGDLHDNATGATSLVTFSRSAASSPGTYVGADGLIKTAAVNLALYSEQFDQWGAAGGATVSTNQTTAPDGKQTADEITNISGGYLQKSVSTIVSGQTYTLSFFLKAGTTSTVRVQAFGGGSYWMRSDFDLSSGTVSSVLEGTASIEDVGNGWYRCSVTGVISTTSIVIYIVPQSAGTHYAWGAQLEEGTVATPYIRTTSQALAAPRFDHDPVTGESLGLLVEEARTNLVTYSEQMNFYNTIAGIAFDTDSETAPDGQQTADNIIGTSATSTKSLTKIYSSVLGADYTFSVFLKDAGFRYAFISLNNGATPASVDLQLGTISIVTAGAGNDATGASIEYFGNGWYRASVTGQGALTGSRSAAIYLSNDGVYANRTNVTGNNVDGIYAWGAQVEAGAFPSSYIPTAGTSLSRAADVATVEGTDFSSWYNASEGTILAKFRSPTEATRGILSLDDNTANEAIALQSFYSTGTQLVVTDGGTQQANTAASIITDGAAYTGVAAYKASDFAVATAGDVAIDVAGTIPTVDRMRIGVNQGGDYLNGHIARLAYWPVRKTNDILDLISDPVTNNDYQILVKTDNTGSSNNDQFTIPANAGTYDVDWGDGTTSTGVTGAQTHTYPAAGQYVIRMDGITHYRTANGGDKLKLLDVQNWGNQAWTSMSLAYQIASNMIMSATDSPDLSNVSDMFGAFAGATSFNQPIEHWNVSNVTNMESLFNGSTSFNQPIGDWDVSSVTNMANMFINANAFNQPIGDWDVSSVTNYANFMLNKTNLNYDAANLDAIYNGWIANELSPAETITFGTIKYTAAGAEGKDLLERANATVAVSNAVDNGSGLVRLTTAAHGLTTGNNYKVYIKDIVGTTEANGLHRVTVIDATTIDLQGTVFTNAYTSGGTVRTGYGWAITDGGI